MLVVINEQRIQREGSRLVASGIESGHESGDEQGEGVECGASLGVDRDLATLNEHLIDDVDHAIGALDIWTDHSGADVLPLGKVFCGSAQTNRRLINRSITPKQEGKQQQQP